MSLFPNHRRTEVQIGDKTMIFDTGKVAKQANGAVMVEMGETTLLCTAVSTLVNKPGAPFFPLSCDYVEKMYAAGRVPGSYFRREARQGEHEILASRIIDRPCRPLFPEGFMADTQVLAHVFSYDKINDPIVLAVNGCSAALAISDIPWAGPIAAARIGSVDGKLICNPVKAERALSQLDLFMVVGPQGIVMVEAGANFVSEATMIEALMFGQAQLMPVIAAIQQLAVDIGKPKFAFVSPQADAELVTACREVAYEATRGTLSIRDKQARYAAAGDVKKAAVAALAERFPGRDGEIKEIVSSFKDEICRKQIAVDRIRLDGRALDQVRPIEIEVGLLKRAHGSALFTRGETQGLVAVTLGTGHDAQKVETLDSRDNERKFMLHYNFPSFSTGEVKPMRGPGRREVGHGNLAQRGIAPALPSFELFPYIIRSVSEILESNGSSSMATVCGTSLALMDAGVPVQCPVAGVAMGLVKEGDAIGVLTDILGDEDHFGDMDFKVIGNRDGISALQMDIKIDGLDREVLELALSQARAGRIHILAEMDKVISRERADLSVYAPRIYTILINPERIKDLIGPGGKHIKAIQAATGVQIDIEEDGTVRVGASDSDVAERAIELIRAHTSEAEIGKDYDGEVTRVVDFGAFVKIMPGTEGLVHISELAEGHVPNVSAVCKVGDKMKVRVISIERGKVRLSHREAAGENVIKFEARAQREGGDRGPDQRSDRGDRDRGGDRGGGGGGGGRDRGPARGSEQGGRGERNDAAEDRRRDRQDR
ncbi:MAG: polyribonucleotide nucleotidyltransferase [Myxococcales bacterium]|nr:polyribonucleotide nucleotidyltransferase [Myxococcales bacterium]